jgi:hypothetical protein
MCRILFIGNSHTYLHYMPFVLSTLAKERGQEIFTHHSTGEGASLEWHWNQQETCKLITESEWTHVVLQERSRGPLDDRSSMHSHARHLDQWVGETDARTVFFMTWAARGQESDQTVISHAYRDIALECNAMLAPVGKAWELALDRNGCPDLFHRDGRHAGKAGAYLSACVFYALLCGDPIGLNHRIEKDGRLLAELADKEARLLQEAAREAVTRYGIT